MSNEANIFFVDPRGYKGHLKLVDDDANALLVAHAKASQWLASNGYSADGRPSSAPVATEEMPPLRVAAAPGAAHWVRGPDGQMNVCSIHGPGATWVEAGVSKSTGKPFKGFWSCKEYPNCKPQRAEP